MLRCAAVVLLFLGATCAGPAPSPSTPTPVGASQYWRVPHRGQYSRAPRRGLAHSVPILATDRYGARESTARGASATLTSWRQQYQGCPSPPRRGIEISLTDFLKQEGINEQNAPTLILLGLLVVTDTPARQEECKGADVRSEAFPECFHAQMREHFRETRSKVRNSLRGRHRRPI